MSPLSVGSLLARPSKPPVFTPFPRQGRTRRGSLQLAPGRPNGRGRQLLHGVFKVQSGVAWMEPMLAQNGLPKALAYGVDAGEVVAPILIVAGLWTRLAALVVAFDLLMAVVLVFRDKIFTLQESGVALPDAVVLAKEVVLMTRKSPRGLLIITLFLLLGVVGCDGSADFLSGPIEIRLLRVFVQNQTMAPFILEGNTVDVGHLGFHRIYSPGQSTQTPFSFDITRGARAVARITYRVLQIPQRGITQAQDVTIVVTEPNSGAFAATTVDTVWIEILSVQTL